MSTVGFVIVGVLFGLKILWNIAVPYAVAVRAFKSKPGQAKSISLMPFVEMVLLLAAVVLSVFRSLAWPWNSLGVTLIGMGMVVASYVHMVVAGSVAGWIARWLRNRHVPGPPGCNPPG